MRETRGRAAAATGAGTDAETEAQTMTAPRLSMLGAVLAAALVEIGVVGANLGAIPPMAGMLALPLGFAFAVLAVLLAIVSLALGAAPADGRARRLAAAAIVLGIVVAIPAGAAAWQWLLTPYPPIYDVTTDTVDPPRFVNPPGLSADAMTYDRARLAPLQARFYPELGPLRLNENPQDAFAAVAAAAHAAPVAGRQMAGRIPSDPGWFIVYVDPATRTIEGVETSWLFRSRDDFVIQVRAGPGANGSLVEMRSRSRERIGGSTANVNRIRGFLALVKRCAGDPGAPPGS